MDSKKLQPVKSAVEKYNETFGKYVNYLQKGIYPGSVKGTLEQQTECFENFLETSIAGKECNASTLPYVTQKNGKSVFGTQDEDGTIKTYDSNGKVATTRSSDEKVSRSKIEQTSEELSQSITGSLGMSNDGLGK